MKLNALNSFATDLLKEKLEPKGFVRRGNAWYKAVPDVVLSVTVRKMQGRAFDLTFGIVPFVCVKPFELVMSCFQPQGAYNRKHYNEVIRYYNEINCRDDYQGPKFSYHIDSSLSNLNDDRKKDILLRYWNDVYDEAIKPFIMSVTDFSSAVEAIGNYGEYVGRYDKERQMIVYEKHFLPNFMSVFMKLGNSLEYFNYWKPYIDPEKDSRYSLEIIEQEAKEDLAKDHYFSHVLWYWLIISNNEEEINNVVSKLEKYALEWLKKNKIEITRDTQ